MDSTVLFESIVYRKELPEYVDELNKTTNDIKTYCVLDIAVMVYST